MLPRCLCMNSELNSPYQKRVKWAERRLFTSKTAIRHRRSDTGTSRAGLGTEPEIISHKGSASLSSQGKGIMERSTWRTVPANSQKRGSVQFTTQIVINSSTSWPKPSFHPIPSPLSRIGEVQTVTFASEISFFPWDTVPGRHTTSSTWLRTVRLFVKGSFSTLEANCLHVHSLLRQGEVLFADLTNTCYA